MLSCACTSAGHRVPAAIAVLQAASANASTNTAANAAATSWWLRGFHGDAASAAARPRWVSMVRPAWKLLEDTGGMAGVAKLCAAGRVSRWPRARVCLGAAGASWGGCCFLLQLTRDLV